MRNTSDEDVGGVLEELFRYTTNLLVCTYESPNADGSPAEISTHTKIINTQHFRNDEGSDLIST